MWARRFAPLPTLRDLAELIHVARYHRVRSGLGRTSGDDHVRQSYATALLVLLLRPASADTALPG